MSPLQVTKQCLPLKTPRPKSPTQNKTLYGTQKSLQDEDKNEWTAWQSLFQTLSTLPKDARIVWGGGGDDPVHKTVPEMHMKLNLFGNTRRL